MWDQKTLSKLLCHPFYVNIKGISRKDRKILQLALGEMLKKTFFRKLTKYQESQTRYKEHILASLTFRKEFS